MIDVIKSRGFAGQFDKVGVVGSFLCATHCAISAFIPSFLVIIGLDPFAQIKHWDDFDLDALSNLRQSKNSSKEMEHQMTHWSSCSVDLEDPISSKRLNYIIDVLPENILRIKGCTKLDEGLYYSFFERAPSGETFVRPYTGDLITGPKLLAIGPGSNPKILNDIIEKSKSV